MLTRESAQRGQHIPGFSFFIFHMFFSIAHHPFIHLFIYLPIHPSVHPPLTHPSIHPSIISHLPPITNPSSIYLSHHPSSIIHPYTHPSSIHPFLLLCTYPALYHPLTHYLSIHPSTHPFVHWQFIIHPSLLIFTHPSFCPSTFPLSIHISIYLYIFHPSDILPPTFYLSTSHSSTIIQHQFFPVTEHLLCSDEHV